MRAVMVVAIQLGQLHAVAVMFCIGSFSGQVSVQLRREYLDALWRQTLKLSDMIMLHYVYYTHQ